MYDDAAIKGDTPASRNVGVSTTDMASISMERWKIIKWTTGIYSVSTHGRVRNNQTGKILRPHRGKCGDMVYHFAELRISKCKFKPTIHRLVGDCFIKNPHKKPLIDHIDRDTFNNHVSNLRWATHAENAMNRRHYPTENRPYKGVIKVPSGRWKALITTEDGPLYLGTYDDAMEAHWVYMAAAVFYFGEFASDGT